MLIHPQFDPVAFQIGPLAVRWYGLMYLVAFILFVVLGTLRARQPQYAQKGWQRRDIEDMLFWGVLGVVIGGRIGFCLFYQPAYYFANPIEILYVWRGGMSFHGGMLGVIIAMILYAYSRKRPWLEVTDLIAPCVPLGLAAGRLGNFINGELWGRFADPSLPWAMVFPQSGSMLPRHPSQIYQFLMEGVLLFVLLWFYARKPRYLGEVSGAFLLGYGIFRFIAEHFREPDSYIGLEALGLSRGQWLSVPMILAGMALWIWAHKRAQGGSPNTTA